MEQVRPDSMLLPARQDVGMQDHEDTSRREAAITKMLTAGVKRDADGRFAKRSSAVPTIPETPTACPSKPEAPQRSTVPAPRDAPDGTYGLLVAGGGLGLHAALGASLLVAPEMPTGAGLAAVYMKGKAAPIIFDLTHSFRPECLDPIALVSGSVALIEVVAPGSGLLGGIRADLIEKIHDVIGVYTPAEIAMKHRIAPPALPVMTECPEGMGEQYVDDPVAYPLVRKGETVVYDPSRREPVHGALCVLQWNGGNRDVMLTNLRRIGDQGDPQWMVDPVNRPASREARPLYTSDGPYDAHHLREKIVGTVVGVLVPQRVAETTRKPEVEAGPDLTPPRSANEIYAAREREREAVALFALDDAGLTSSVSAEMRAAILRHGEVMQETQLRHNETDEEFDRNAGKQNDAEYAVARAPVRTLADLRAKLTYLGPILAEDMLSQTQAAHLDAIRDDVDQLCRQPAVLPPDPIIGVIEEAWRLTREHGRLLDICAGHPESHPSHDPEHEAHGAMWDHLRRVLFKTVPTTAQGCIALARFATAFTDVQGVPLGGDGIDPILDLIARSPGLLTVEPVAHEFERAFHGASTELRLATRDHERLINSADHAWVAQNGGDASPETMALAIAARDAASDRQERAWRDLFKARPRTNHQMWLLLRNVAQHFDTFHGMVDEPDVLGALVGAADGLRLTAPDTTASHDLTKLSVWQLEALAEICRRHARDLLEAARGWNEGPLVDVLDEEQTRINLLGGMASAEIERRVPVDRGERDLRLETLIRSDLSGNGYIEPALLAEAVAAWGTR